MAKGHLTITDAPEATTHPPAAVPATAAEDLPAIVLGGHVTALGVVRCLGRLGVTAYLVSDRRDYAARSRWVRPLPGGPPESPEPGPLARFLETLSLERALVLPCSDDWARAAAALPAELRSRFPSPIARPEALEQFLDKEHFAALVARLAVPHPRTVVLRRDDLSALEAFDFAVPGAQLFLKPTDSQDFVRHFGVKALALHDEADARARLDEVWAAGIDSMLVQEYVPGPVSSHYFVDGYVRADGEVAARLARRRLRMYPRDFGNSTYHVSVPLAEVEAAPEHIDRLLRETDFRGIFSAEFKRDERDGLFRILEVNVRPWWYIHFAATCGVDVCELAHREARGLTVEPVRSYRTGERCVLLGADVRAYLDQRGEDGVGFFAWLATWLGATRVVFSSRDPLPALLHVQQVGARRLRRLLRLRPRARPAS